MCQVVRTPELVSTLGQRFSTLPATRRMGGTRRYSWGVLECKHSLPGIVRILLLVIVIVYEDLFVWSVQPHSPHHLHHEDQNRNQLHCKPKVKATKRQGPTGVKVACGIVTPSQTRELGNVCDLLPQPNTW